MSLTHRVNVWPCSSVMSWQRTELAAFEIRRLRARGGQCDSAQDGNGSGGSKKGGAAAGADHGGLPWGEGIG